jgi:hypothetical protein
MQFNLIYSGLLGYSYITLKISDIGFDRGKAEGSIPSALE